MGGLVEQSRQDGSGEEHEDEQEEEGEGEPHLELGSTT
jgi:hypothetical protein